MIWYLAIHHLLWTEPTVPPIERIEYVGPYTASQCEYFTAHYQELGSWHMISPPTCEMVPIKD